MLAHEKLHVYRYSIEFLALSDRMGGAVRRGNSILLEQVKRAGMLTKMCK